MALVKIETSDLRLGMYIHSLEGSWLSHPFWTHKFLLEKEKDLHRLLDSNIKHVVIDDSLGQAKQEMLTFKPQISSAVTGKRSPSYTRASKKQNKQQLDPVNGEVVPQDELTKARLIIDRSKLAVMSMFEEARMGKLSSFESLDPLIDQIAESIDRDASIMVNVARIKNKDEYTYLHSVAVCALMITLAKKLKMEQSRIRELGRAGLLHDLGKMAIDDSILNKPGPLTEAEYQQIRTHPEKGAKWLLAAGNVPATIYDVCLHHHEKVDGSGYPHMLAGENISLGAKMAAICDVYDAVTSKRAYNSPWAPSTALYRMAQWEGHFDPVLLQTFIDCLGILPDQTLVQLASGKLAIVHGVGEKNVTKPIVRAFWNIGTRARCRLSDIDLSIVSDEAVLCIENPQKWPFPNWETYCSTILEVPVAA